MKHDFYKKIRRQIDTLTAEGLYKTERVLKSQQQSKIKLDNGKEVLNFCSNNYLGLANAPELIAAGRDGLEQYGYGMASVRFICGTHSIHKDLEIRISQFLSMEDTILYSSCFDANGGLFETILSSDDAVISDALNHASIIDGIRLSKAKRYRYANNDMADLETQLQMADKAGVETKLIATDGVFSMDGVIANLQEICDLADTYEALVMVDDSHAVGIMGEQGAGTPEFCRVIGRIDLITGTLGKALGGASGGYISGKKEVVELLRNRSRPYLFSNTLAPAITAASIKVLDILSTSGIELRKKLSDNTKYFRSEMSKLGFTITGNDHPIVPVMLEDATLTAKFADRMLEEGIYVIGFSFPVVPKGQSRIRTQMSATHSTQEIDKALGAFSKIGQEFGVVR